ncbi:MAG TPA: hypothetical protein VM243_00245 [Phycisphaerae bacterium]|nr:hypothetical protein [Phycisphaerae bacterium]
MNGTRQAVRGSRCGAGCRRRPSRRSAFTLVLVLALFAAVGGLATVLTLHAGQLVRSDRLRTLDIELRQMIDSGAAYARLHHEDWAAEVGIVVLDGSDLIGGDARTGEVTLQPVFDRAGAMEAVTISARIHLPRGRSRVQSARVTL